MAKLTSKARDKISDKKFAEPKSAGKIKEKANKVLDSSSKARTGKRTTRTGAC